MEDIGVSAWPYGVLREGWFRRAVCDGLSLRATGRYSHTAAPIAHIMVIDTGPKVDVYQPMLTGRATREASEFVTSHLHDLVVPRGHFVSVGTSQSG